MPSSTSSNDGHTMPSKLRNLVQAQKPDIKINFSTKKKTYTTLDRIEGSVTVVPQVDTNFDSIDIEFIGTSRTYVERLTTAAAASGRSEAFHQFLKLQQPGLHQLYPEDLVLRAGKIYDFPFVFVVPQQLLPRVCQHPVQSDATREAHFRLPPTFGDKGLTSQKGSDDMAPDMASIRYGVFSKITELKMKGDDALRCTVASKARRLRVIPAVEEQPPLDVHTEDGEYFMRKEKSIRKGLLKGRLGTLTMESAQPQAFKMKSYNNPESRMTTMATVMLRFDPLDDALPPPKLGNLASKLKVTTYFSSVARDCFPSKQLSMYDLSQGLHTEQFSLSSRCVNNVEWTKQEPSPALTLERRGSALSSSSLETGDIPEASEGYKGGLYYTTRILVPITLPTNKAFPPTFHSCLISRVYALKLDLGISSPGLGSTMEVKVPVQISSQDLVSDDFARRESISGVEEAEVDVEDVSNFFSNNGFEPRTIRVPSVDLVGRSRIGSQAPTADAPPGYTPMNEGRVAPSVSYQRLQSVPVY
ncbi:uncharacterized protein LTR77_004333 [Saxophila tyrrhenica]|uniref:Arrestin-like N-terminal domain-containing protein n=1 Tax=Saxophila tyrrhenica TaxID=1690608 RepID=A0AAV9PEX8_9PEZI|nr:hypothetical protein LTR77_004333 [Saxophila tyrrhenica]